MALIPNRKNSSDLKSFSKIYKYPCGIVDIVSSSSPDFMPPGYEISDVKKSPNGVRKCADPQAEDLGRSMRRARARVRRLALANDFKWFVTLTLSPDKIDRYDAAAIVKRLGQWCSNHVKRNDLRYILVPERHKDGALHFHGFFNDSLEAVPSGHKSHGRMVYNFPQWDLGFTAGIEVYGEYSAAVAYCCKYIGKQGEKPAGRWYYSGGNLSEPSITYANIDIADLEKDYGSKCFVFNVPGKKMAVVNGILEE